MCADAPPPDALLKIAGSLTRNPPPPSVTEIPAIEPDVVADTCAVAPYPPPPLSVIVSPIT
jgi:hypothetical protein